MPKRADTASPLMVVATADPSAFFGKKKQDLAMFTDSDGNSYITNAGLQAHASPFTGDIVESEGVPVSDVALDPETALSIECETCETVNLMDAVQASTVEDHEISCIACGSTIEYEIASDEDDEDSEEANADDDFEDPEEASGDEDDDDAEEAGLQEDDLSEEASGDDDDDDDDDSDDDDDDEDDEDRPLDMVDFEKASDDEDDDAEEASGDDDDADEAEEASGDDDEDDAEEASADDDDVLVIIEAKRVPVQRVPVRTKAIAVPKPKKKKSLKNHVVPETDVDGDDYPNLANTEAPAEETPPVETQEEATVQLADVTLASVADAKEELTLVALADDKAALFVGDLCVATITSSAPNWDLLETATYQRSLELAIKRSGLEASLKEAGFTLNTIRADAALANAGKVSDEVVASAIESGSAAYAARLKDCMDVVAAGALRGMFAKSGAGDLANAIEAKLAQLNVGNAKDVVRQIMESAGASYSNGLIESAHALTLKDDTAIASLREQIEEMASTSFDYVSKKPETAAVLDDVDPSLEDKLTRPARVSETAAVTPTPTAGNRFSGIFSFSS